MADSSDNKPKLPLTSMLALLAVVSGLLVSQIPLKTSRPIGKEAESHVFVGDDRVQSRLWQDPFDAVESHLEKEHARSEGSGESSHEHHGLPDLAKVIHALAPDHPSFIMMPVMVDGNPYANGVESRLRHRYAVVSGLGAVEYLPEAAEYVRFFRWTRPSCGTPHCPSIVVPVEWYKPKPSIRQHAPPVLVIWVKAQDFGERPLARLAELVHDLRNEFNFAQHQFKILGPRGSGGLAGMVQEVKQPSHALAPLKGVEIFSSWATAEDTFLIGNPPEESTAVLSLSSGTKTVESLFDRAGISLIRTMGTDSLLAQQLIRELHLRGVNVTEPCFTPGCQDHVALISEWDSLYGRVLPRTFVAVANNRGDGRTGPDLTSHLNVLRQDQWPEWAHHYSYLAGLDGELPPKDPGKGSMEGPTRGSFDLHSMGTVLGMERPIGRGQLDYLRRLAKTLLDEEAGIPGGFRAIGVLGSDVYDKLLVLQALRPSFPQAIFFTTDLDGRLAHPEQLPWTRNLIIASHFGLELRKDLQEPIPPFRDAYQTALFFSMLQALQKPGTQIEISQVSPRVFEVGRSGPFDLSRFDPLGSPPSIHPTRADLDPSSGLPREISWRTFLMIGGILVLILLCAMLVSSEVWDGTFVLLASPRFWGTTGLALAVILGVVWWAMSDGADGEPFVFMDGISVWPTQAIRLLAFFLCGGFFVYAGWSLRTNEARLIDRFDFPGLPKGVPSGLGLGRVIGIHHWRPSSGRSTPVHQVWLDYLRLGRWPNRWVRYSLQAILYWLLGVLLLQAFGLPHTPCRGQACFLINIVVLMASVLGMVLLMFFVVDATRLCRRFIKHLVEEQIEWPDEWLKKEAKRRGVHPDSVHEWLSIDLIAARTDVIGHLIYYPFIVLFLMYVARHPSFDRWDFPIGLILLLTINAVYAFGNAVALRRSAEQAKQSALTQLRKKLVRLSDTIPGQKESREQVERVIEAVRNNHEGAFLPFTAHPIFGAIALPSGGYGLVLLMEYLGKAL